jgi:hypothetical protein
MVRQRHVSGRCLVSCQLYLNKPAEVHLIALCDALRTESRQDICRVGDRPTGGMSPGDAQAGAAGAGPYETVRAWTK